jgi:uncharacterized protein (DUF427 family)
MDLLREAERPTTYSRPFGPGGPVGQWYDIEVGGRHVPAAAWTRDTPELAGLVIVSWEPGVLDRWMEEDEVVFAHPRDPHHRVDALPSSRHVTVSLDGRLLAETHTPVLLFETGLPTRYYLPQADLVSPDLTPASHETACPYKGVADRYWSLVLHSPVPGGGAHRRAGGVLQRARRHLRRRCGSAAPHDTVQRRTPLAGRTTGCRGAGTSPRSHRREDAVRGRRREDAGGEDALARMPAVRTPQR